MKSTIKIDYAVSASRHIPLIKIICPIEVLKISEDEDVDTRDKLIKDFLQSPNSIERNYFFELGTYGRLDNSKPEVITIEPIEEDALFFKFKYAILSRLVPDSTVYKINCMSVKEIDELLDNKDLERPSQFNEYFEINKFFDNLNKEKKYYNY